jgi:hypothetical protein
VTHAQTRPYPSAPQAHPEAGSAATGAIVAVLILVAVAVGAFFYFGGEADVDIKKPDISVTSSETPN